MACFSVIYKSIGVPMHICWNRAEAINKAEFIRKSGEPCCIQKIFKKAGHPHYAHIKYDYKLEAWIEGESQQFRRITDYDKDKH